MNKITFSVLGALLPLAFANAGSLVVTGGDFASAVVSPAIVIHVDNEICNKSPVQNPQCYSELGYGNEYTLSATPPYTVDSPNFDPLTGAIGSGNGFIKAGEASIQVQKNATAPWVTYPCTTTYVAGGPYIPKAAAQNVVMHFHLSEKDKTCQLTISNS